MIPTRTRNERKPTKPQSIPKARYMSDRYEPKDPNIQLYFFLKKLKEWSSTVAVVISVIALLAVGLQTCQNKREADAAIDAAKAAQEAVRQSRENFQQDQRPYVWLTNDLGKPEFVQRAGTQSGQAIWDWHFTIFISPCVTEDS